MLTLSLLIVGMLCFIPKNSYAYLDPGSGSYVIQVIIGLLAGAVFVLKNYWVVIKGNVRKILGKDKEK